MKDNVWKRSYNNIKRLLEGNEDIEYSEERSDDFDEDDDYVEDDAEKDYKESTHATGRDDRPLRELSPYSSYFSYPEESAFCESKTEEDNDLFKIDALIYIHKTWLPTYGLWGQPTLRGVKNVKKYLTNAKVESWFR